MAIEISDIPGAEDVVHWFGYWPDFHDAEVLSITLNRSTGTTVEIHTFEMTSDVDAQGFYVLAKHVIVTFVLEGFPLNQEGTATTRIHYFNQQNVLSSASVEKATAGYKLVLEGCFGVHGTIGGKKLSVQLPPGNSVSGNVSAPLPSFILRTCDSRSAHVQLRFPQQGQPGTAVQPPTYSVLPLLERFKFRFVSSPRELSGALFGRVYLFNSK